MNKERYKKDSNKKKMFQVCENERWIEKRQRYMRDGQKCQLIR